MSVSENLRAGSIEQALLEAERLVMGVIGKLTREQSMDLFVARGIIEKMLKISENAEGIESNHSFDAYTLVEGVNFYGNVGKAMKVYEEEGINSNNLFGVPWLIVLWARAKELRVYLREDKIDIQLGQKEIVIVLVVEWR